MILSVNEFLTKKKENIVHIVFFKRSKEKGEKKIHLMGEKVDLAIMINSTHASVGGVWDPKQ